MPETAPNMVDEALRLAMLGYRVFPLGAKTKVPLAGSHGVRQATREPGTIRAWWAERPDANIGLACGEGLLALDVDPGAIEAFGAEEVAALELDWIGKPRSRTPRGGFHLFMREPEGVILRNSAGKIGTGLDIKCAGGYIVAPPSRVVDPAREIDGAYEWIEPLACAPDALPTAPAWLAPALLGAHTIAPARNGTVGDAIPEGRRNDALASIAGHLRRIGLDDRAIAAALHAVNRERCKPSLDEREVERIAASIARYEPQVDLVAEAVSGVDLSAFLTVPPAPPDDPLEPAPLSVGELIGAYPALRPPVIHGLLREGETMNVIAAPKTGKSWLTLDLAIAVATGRQWLGTYPTEAGEVLIIDNELHRETSAHRIPKVAEARGVAMRQLNNRISIDNLRGRLRCINTLAPYFEALEPGRFKVIVLDAFYRFMPAGGDENDNGTMANIYNRIDAFADRLGCCFVLIHHSTKGSQSGKSVTDVGAGAGAQSRATDTHLVLRPHEEHGVVVLDAAVRSWKPVNPTCLRWAFPVWQVDRDLDPTQLKSERPKKRTPKKPDEPSPDPWSVERFVEVFISSDPASKPQIREAAMDEPGLSWRRVSDLLVIAEQNGLIEQVQMPGRGGPKGYTLSNNGGRS